ncbi:MAG: DUF3105 domain-containing protein [Paracoccaceae bacterium]
MPKSKSKKKPRNTSGKNTPYVASNQINYGENIGKTSKRTNVTASFVTAAILLGSGYFWWNNSQQNSQNDALTSELAIQGQGALAQVRSIRSQGAGHLRAGASLAYDEEFATSGNHASRGINPGFYQSELPQVNVVHGLEHGSVAIYIDTPGEDAVQILREWVAAYDKPWQGVIVSQSPGLGSAVVLTAWTKSLRLERFDAAAAAAFLDAYRGRGPEKSVR